MTYDPQIHDRHSLRLPGYDYTRSGNYFITINAANHEHIFGQLANGIVELNGYGLIVAECWRWLPEHHPHVELDEWVVMPNHFHGIIVINNACRGGSRTAPTDIAGGGSSRKPLGRLIGAFKTVSTKKINQVRGTPGETIWKRNYYEHIIRNEESLRTIRQYIVDNPAGSELDQLFAAESSRSKVG